MPTRRAVLMSALAAAVGSRQVMAQAGTAAEDARQAAPTVLRLERTTIEVDGKPASVYGIRQPDGAEGITTHVGDRFRVRVENAIGEPSLVHWHGLAPPWQQDGVPGISGPPIQAAAAPITTFRSPMAARSGCTRIRDCRSSCCSTRR